MRAINDFQQGSNTFFENICSFKSIYLRIALNGKNRHKCAARARA